MKQFKGFQRGINLGGWLSQFDKDTKEYFDTFIVEQDIKDIARMGLDHVRLPIDYTIIEDEQGNEKMAGYQYIDHCVQWCKKYGLHLILDLHHTFGYTFDPLIEIEDREAFFKEEALQDRFITLWKRLAKRYGNDKDIAFELLNEVISGEIRNEWNAIALRAIKEIHKITPETYVIVGGVYYNNVRCVPDLPAPMDEYMVYNFHCYEPLVFTHQKAYWVENMPKDLVVEYPCSIETLKEKSAFLSEEHAGAIHISHGDRTSPAFFEELFSEAIAHAQANNVPLYCGEYGVIDQAPLDSTVNWLKDIHTVFEKYQIGRALWTYKKKDFGLTDEHYAPIKEKMIPYL